MARFVMIKVKKIQPRIVIIGVVISKAQTPSKRTDEIPKLTARLMIAPTGRREKRYNGKLPEKLSFN